MFLFFPTTSPQLFATFNGLLFQISDLSTAFCLNCEFPCFFSHFTECNVSYAWHHPILVPISKVLADAAIQQFGLTSDSFEMGHGCKGPLLNSLAQILHATLVTYQTALEERER